MKRILLAVLLLYNLNVVEAQVFKVDTIVFNGDVEKHINVVLLGDGYKESELEKFSEDAISIKEALFSVSPYSNYKNFFNVFSIATPSIESGASHPGTATDVTEPAHVVKEVDNIFGSSFDAFGIHRLLVPNKSSAIFGVLANNFPLYDQVLVIVNSEFYGGSGGVFATTSLNSSATEIAIHEIGHSFADLIDEYYAGDQYAREGVNMTAETDPEKVKWRNWMGFNGVGIYQHCCGGNSSTWYRPHENCKMRILGPDFCPVCIEGTIERIHTLVPSITNFEPEQLVLNVEALPLYFKVDYNKPDPNSMLATWSLNSEILENTGDSLTLTQDMLQADFNEVLFAVEDQSDLLRVDDHASIHTEYVLWEITNSSSGIEEIKSTHSRVNINVFPNPTQDYIFIENMEEVSAHTTVKLYNTIGVEIASKVIAGKNQQIFDMRNLSPGTYYVKVKVRGRDLATKKIVKL